VRAEGEGRSDTDLLSAAGSAITRTAVTKKQVLPAKRTVIGAKRVLRLAPVNPNLSLPQNRDHVVRCDYACERAVIVHHGKRQQIVFIEKFRHTVLRLINAGRNDRV
jgi:hypothetical protein